MNFGPVSVQRAKGAILAHSVRCGDVRIRKGKLLSQEDIEALIAVGLKEVVVAIIERDEIDENQAAKTLADGFAIAEDDSDISVTKAFTGRVNLLAKSDGIVRVDANKIHAFNQVNPMITVATVPDYHRVEKGGMLATIKVISFGVKASDAASAAAQIEGAITLEVPKLKSAALIVTSLDLSNSPKGIEAVRARLERWGVALEKVEVVEHSIAAVASALKEANAEVVLILTASATSDIRDVAPSAVKMSGGAIERFGMPVDPGNLLFIGSLRGSHVVGLPGCARSPALNGADWVLGRIICGIEVSDQDISAMGVGGLLKEIPSRPHPRDRMR